MLASSHTIILNRVCALWIISYFLIANPTAVYSSVPVVLVGESAGLPHIHADTESGLSGILAMVMLVMALDDFCSLFVLNPLPRLRAVVPLRLIFFFAFSAASYLKVGPFGNSLMLAYGMAEMMINFWLYGAVREENNEWIRKTIRESRGQEEM